MNLFQMLKDNRRIIVMSSEPDELLYTWSAIDKIIQCWHLFVNIYGETDLNEVASMVDQENNPQTYEEARHEAVMWHLDPETSPIHKNKFA